MHHSNLEIDRLKQKLRQTDDRIEDLEGKTFPSLTLIDPQQDLHFPSCTQYVSNLSDEIPCLTPKEQLNHNRITGASCQYPG